MCAAVIAESLQERSTEVYTVYFPAFAGSPPTSERCYGVFEPLPFVPKLQEHSGLPSG